METKEDWINETMKSLDGTSRAEPDPLLFDMLLQPLQHYDPIVITNYSRMIWRAAALILVLISFNVITLVCFSKRSDNVQNTVKSVANEYFSYIDSINL